MNLLTAKEISKLYTDRHLFTGADFSIEEGDKVGVVGINGTGKSTLLRCLNLLETPTSGEIIIDNEYLFKNQRVYLKLQIKELLAKQKTA